MIGGFQQPEGYEKWFKKMKNKSIEFNQELSCHNSIHSIFQISFTFLTKALADRLILYFNYSQNNNIIKWSNKTSKCYCNKPK